MMTQLISTLDVLTVSSLIAIAIFVGSMFLLLSVLSKALKPVSEEQPCTDKVEVKPKTTFFEQYSDIMGFKELEEKLQDHKSVQAVLMNSDATLVEDTRHILSSSSFELSTVHESEGLMESREDPRWI
jgi:hypothetical protein